MKQLPEISIIVPVYNVEEYIAECIQSVMRQTYGGGIECILVDDCGTDNSISIAEKLISEYKGHISFRIIHHDHNCGLSAARNTGTVAATGDYIYYLDSDDYISNDCLETLTQPLNDVAYDMIIGDFALVGPYRDIPRLNKSTGAIIGSRKIVDNFYIGKTLYVMSWNKLIKKTLFDSHDLMFAVGQIHEDELWMYKCCLALSSLYVQKRVTYCYRMREDSIMGLSKHHIQKRADSFFITLDYVLNHPLQIDKDIWNSVVSYYMGHYLPLSLQTKDGGLAKYISLRKRFQYNPLTYYRQKKFSMLDVKHQFHYVLPPVLGFIYLKMREIKQKIVSKSKITH